MKNGPKLNDNALALVDGQRSTKAVARYVKGSATKVRVVLDLIRGLDARRADEVLQFTDRAAAADVRKVLASAVANAVHNDNQDPDELYVVACYADEGPTLKRFRPRARGRASRINKRSSHITVIVARLSDARLDVIQNRRTASAAGRRGGLTPQSRADRVARSRARAEGARGGNDAGTTDTGTDDTVIDDDTLTDESTLAEAALTDDTSTDDATSTDDTSADDTAAVNTLVDLDADLDADADADTTDTDADTDEAATTSAPDAELPAGAVAAPDNGSIPDGYEIKGNANSMKYHLPGTRYYDVTIAEVYFDTAEHAEAAGYEAPAGTTPAEGEDS